MSQAGSPNARREPELALADAVRELSQRIDALQTEVRRLVPPDLPPVDHERGEGLSDPQRFAWIAALEPPARRPPTVPRLLLECLFLLAVALGAGLARLDALVVAGVMIGAWALVALLEWTALRASRRETSIGAAPAAPVDPRAASDPAWLVPPVQPTILEPPAESPTTVAPLPSRAGGPEVTVESTAAS